jgi:hypothetical protein
MIEFMPRSHDNVVAVRIGGKLSAQDYEELLIPRLDEILASHRHVDIMFVLQHDFAGWTMGAAWDDLAYALRHRRDIERVAVVGGSDWVSWCLSATHLLIKGEVRTYKAHQLESAWAWVDVPHAPPAKLARTA